MKVIQYRVLLTYDPNSGQDDRFEFVTVTARNLTSGVRKAAQRAARLCLPGQVVTNIEFWAVLS